MAFMKAILDNGTPTGHSDANSSGSEEDMEHARLSLRRDDESPDDKVDKKDEEGDENDDTKSHKSSEEEQEYSSFSESDNEKEKKNKIERRISESSSYSQDDQPKVKRKPPKGSRRQPWSNVEPQSHQDMLQEKFSQLQDLLTDHDRNQMDKQLLKKTRAMMRHYQVAQAGLVPGLGFKGSKSPRSEKQWARSTNAWQEEEKGREYTNATSPVTGDEYILIDGTGDEVKTRRVKFSNIETESIPDGDPSLQALGSLGIPIPVAPVAPRPRSGWNRQSRPRRKAASAERPRGTNKEKPQRKSATRSPSAESRERSRSSSRSQSRSRSRSESRKRDAEKLKKTDHHLKDTDNKTLQEWLKKKDKELKAKKKEARKIRKDKRDQKRQEYEEKEKLKEKSEEAVRVWFVKKEEEERLLQRRERVRRPLQKNEFSYSLELITLNKSPEAEPDDHHASNPEINSTDRTSGGAIVSRQRKGTRKLRAKSAKARVNHTEKTDTEQIQEDRKSYEQWLKEKQELDKKNKEEKSAEAQQNNIANNTDAEQAEDLERGLTEDQKEEEKQKVVDVESKQEEEPENREVSVNDLEKEGNERPPPDMDDEELLTDVGQRRDVNMNIQRKDSDTFDPYDKPKDYTLDPETRRNLMQYSDLLEKEEMESPTKSESSQPSFRLPSPPLISHSPVPTREKSLGGNIVEHEAPDLQASVMPHPPRPDVPRTSAYRRVKREQSSWDEFSDNVWTQVNEEAGAPLTDNPHTENDQEVNKSNHVEDGSRENEPDSKLKDKNPGEKLSEDGGYHQNDYQRTDGVTQNSNESVSKEPEFLINNDKAEETHQIEHQSSVDGEKTIVEESPKEVKDEVGEPGMKVEESELTKQDAADKEAIDDADQEPPALIPDERKADEQSDAIPDNSEAPESVMTREEFEQMAYQALHLNPIREESELEAETEPENQEQVDGISNDNTDIPESVSQHEKQINNTEDKGGTTFLTTSED